MKSIPAQNRRYGKGFVTATETPIVSKIKQGPSHGRLRKWASSAVMICRLKEAGLDLEPDRCRSHPAIRLMLLGLELGRACAMLLPASLAKG